jgi:hypothetical protein
VVPAQILPAEKAAVMDVCCGSCSSWGRTACACVVRAWS